MVPLVYFVPNMVLANQSGRTGKMMVSIFLTCLVHPQRMGVVIDIFRTQFLAIFCARELLYL